jgi:hypothetical protein
MDMAGWFPRIRARHRARMAWDLGDILGGDLQLNLGWIFVTRTSMINSLENETLGSVTVNDSFDQLLYRYLTCIRWIWKQLCIEIYLDF